MIPRSFRRNVSGASGNGSSNTSHSSVNVQEQFQQEAVEGSDTEVTTKVVVAGVEEEQDVGVPDLTSSVSSTQAQQSSRFSRFKNIFHGSPNENKSGEKSRRNTSPVEDQQDSEFQQERIDEDQAEDSNLSVGSAVSNLTPTTRKRSPSTPTMPTHLTSAGGKNLGRQESRGHTGSFSTNPFRNDRKLFRYNSQQ